MPGASVATHVPERWEIGLVWGLNFALILVTWTMTRRYTDSLVAEPAPTPEAPPSDRLVGAAH